MPTIRTARLGAVLRAPGGARAQKRKSMSNCASNAKVGVVGQVNGVWAPSARPTSGPRLKSRAAASAQKVLGELAQVALPWSRMMPPK